ncbi:hypothetical protein OJ998_07480 [Solirubrobacter taibaiensis]|nr:hypothetical protein [Solirubrobacter taibaiensis]
MLRNTTKLVGVALATMAAGGAIAPAANADSVFFTVGVDGRATVGAWVDGSSADARLELVRGGTVIAKGTPADEWSDGAMHVSNLVAGDVLNVYRGTALLGGVSYAGRPMVRQDACAGRTSFTVVRDENAVIDGAGAFVPTGGGSGDHSRAIWTHTDAFATVTVDRALVLGEVAWVQTDASVRWADDTLVWVRSRREMSVPACPAPSGPASPVAPVTTTTIPVDQTPAQIKAALKTTGKQLGKLDPAKLGRKASFALNFAAPAAGTARLHLTVKANGKTIALGEGSAKATKAQPLKVTVKLPKAVRTLLKRSKRLSITLVATFDPAASGVQPSQTATTVTLKRRAKAKR